LFCVLHSLDPLLHITRQTWAPRVSVVDRKTQQENLTPRPSDHPSGVLNETGDKRIKTKRYRVRYKTKENIFEMVEILCLPEKQIIYSKQFIFSSHKFAISLPYLQSFTLCQRCSMWSVNQKRRPLNNWSLLKWNENIFLQESFVYFTNFVSIDWDFFKRHVFPASFFNFHASKDLSICVKPPAWFSSSNQIFQLSLNSRMDHHPNDDPSEKCYTKLNKHWFFSSQAKGGRMPARPMRILQTVVCHFHLISCVFFAGWWA